LGPVTFMLRFEISTFTEGGTSTGALPILDIKLP
jgi:hypothetical protein